MNLRRSFHFAFNLFSKERTAWFSVSETTEQSIERSGDADGWRYVDEQRQKEARHVINHRRSHERHRGRFCQRQHHRSLGIRVGKPIKVPSFPSLLNTNYFIYYLCKSRYRKFLSVS